MREAGRALNDTFKHNNAGIVTGASAPADGVAVVNATGRFDYVVTMEDLRRGQRVGNYSIEYRVKGSAKDAWQVLVPPVQPLPPSPRRLRCKDRPDGRDRKPVRRAQRMTYPIVDAKLLDIEQVRFNCIRLVASVDDPADSNVHLRQLSLHKRAVPWEHADSRLPCACAGY